MVDTWTVGRLDNVDSGQLIVDGWIMWTPGQLIMDGWIMWTPGQLIVDGWIMWTVDTSA